MGEAFVRIGKDSLNRMLAVKTSCPERLGGYIDERRRGGKNVQSLPKGKKTITSRSITDVCVCVRTHTLLAWGGKSVNATLSATRALHM